LDTAVIEVCKTALIGWKDIITKGTGHGAPPCSVSDRAARVGAGRYEDKKDQSILCVWRLLQAEAGPMGCEPRGFGWSATVEVCSVRVTRLVTDQEKSEKFPGAKLVPGISRVNEICQHSDSGIAKVPGTGLGGWFASIQACRSRCLAPAAWTHLLRGQDLPAFRFWDRNGTWHHVGRLCPDAA
jgi:hypothetical protein